MSSTEKQKPARAHLPARLGWQLDQEQLMYTNADQPNVGAEQIIRFLPSMPWMMPETAELVLDLEALLRSAQTPGGHMVLNCSCGYAPDAGIDTAVFVSHPTADLIVWHLNWENYGHLISTDVPRVGSGLELHFLRGQYEADLFTMGREVETAHLELPVYELQPLNMDDFQRLIAELHNSPSIHRIPVLPHGSVLEFGFLGGEYCFINGQRDSGWVPSLFPDDQTYDAFNAWMAFVKRGWALSPAIESNNNFFLLREEDRDACDEAGRYLVSCLREAWATSAPPQLVEVRLKPCHIPTADRGGLTPQAASKS